jgi:hypothetical protein
MRRLSRAMGMDLNGAGGYQRFSNTSWCKMLELAHMYGWKPAGTEPGQWVDQSTGELNEQMSPDPDEWDGSYFTNDFQWVADEDAAHIADALEQALDDIPDFDTNEKWVEYGSTNLPTSPVERSLVEEGFVVSGPNESLSSLEFFSGEDKQQVRDFIAYCRAGAFFIA